MPSARYDNTDGRMRGRKLQERRMRVWSKDPRCSNPKCRVLTAYPEGFQLDHTVALVNGGLDTEENTSILCIDCHLKKTERDMGYAESTRFTKDGRVVW